MDASSIEARMWPRALAVAERLWSPRSQVWVENTTVARLNKASCQVLERRGVRGGPVASGFCPWSLHWDSLKTDDDDLHVFWGMAGDDDLRIPDNNCTKCFAAGNFIRSAPANVQAQPSSNHPHPTAGCPTCEPPIPKSPGWRDLTPFSKAVNGTVFGGVNPWNHWNHGMGGLKGAPVGRRTMSFDGGAPCGNHHPQDNIFAKLGDKNVCKNAKGQLTNWTGLWWDNGIEHLKKDWTDFLVALKASGGDWDVITVDTECNTLDGAFNCLPRI